MRARVWLLWALGDILGITTFAPAFALLLGPGGLREGLWRDRVGRREQVVWGIALLLSLAGIVSAGRSGNLYALGLVSMPLALLLWAAVRFSPMTTMVGTILVVTFISLLTGLGLGGFTRPLTLLDASVLMLLLVLISVIPVMLAVATYEQRHTATALYLRATRDPLTGLLNRSTFEERARERLTGEKADPDLSLLYLDLDHFKLVNDSASHVAGDDMIRTVGRMVGAEFGEEALVARTGGDEFAVLVPRERIAGDHLRPASARVHRRPAHHLGRPDAHRRGEHRHRAQPRAARGFRQFAVACGRGMFRGEGIRRQPPGRRVARRR